MKKTGAFLKKAACVLFWIAVWEILSLLIGEAILIASPVQAFTRLLELARTWAFYAMVLRSAGRILLGFAAAVILSVPVSLASSRSRFLRELISPLISFLKSVPVASFIILALVFFSSRYLSTLIAFMIAFPVLYINTLNGFTSYDPLLMEMAELYRVGPARRFTGILLPAAMPHFVSALSVAVGLSWKSGIAAEIIGIPSGTLGEALYRAKVYLMTGDLFALTFVIVFMNFLTEKLLRLLFGRLERRLLR